MLNKKQLGAIGAALVVVVAGFLGVDLTKTSTHSAQNSSSARSTQAPSSSAVASTSAKATPKPSNKPTDKAAAGQCPVNTLPEQAKPVIDAIKRGGPFKYPANDGVHFGNYENRLPKNNYKEYTVDTPGLNHRGERRIITGDNPPTWYYTADHYETFCEIPDAQ